MQKNQENVLRQLTKNLPKGKPKAAWIYNMENNVRKMRIVNWREKRKIDGKRRAARDAIIFLGSGATE